MASDLKATIVICILTLFLSIGTAYGILKIDDNTACERIKNINSNLEFIQKTVQQQQKTLNMFQVQIRENTISANRTEQVISKLDITMSRFADKIEIFSTTVGRLDERLKNIERGR